MGRALGQLQLLPRAATSRPARSSLVLAAGAAVFAATCYYNHHHQHLVDEPSRLNRDRFVRYVVTGREPVSPSSTLLTVASQTNDQWRHGLWSVEVKQPEVQIARHYTPLPPSADGDNGLLLFYLRNVQGGEMSSYLARLAVGNLIWLRGPHPGFDIIRRLGSRTRLVVLAGGTGLAPAMQAAATVLDKPNTSATILWAVRRRDEIQSSPSAPPSWWKLWLRGPTPIQLGPHLENATPLALRLRQMKDQYGSRLDIRVAIDDESSTFRDDQLERILLLPPSSSAPFMSSMDCGCHDQSLHASASELDPSDETCLCPSAPDAKPGKNIFIVSGPDGFVSHYAGPKIWSGGTLTQGPVGGVVAKLQRRYPSLAREWLVLKL
ncbi:hypothetical protein XA68_18215 [Ophiocordyceps unilateralis]|uniref:FAD-binding FR-type domain-containing protein n=1 Tax=Ophiocordyceps unilateralis TaxID=268505 RepID=A0A2A9PNZ0_OPHUN|nr:hypothetical protein XA68_18215 [Ophiocordyceps unilateralis]